MRIARIDWGGGGGKLRTYNIIQLRHLVFLLHNFFQKPFARFHAMLFLSHVFF